MVPAIPVVPGRVTVAPTPSVTTIVEVVYLLMVSLLGDERQQGRERISGLHGDFLPGAILRSSRGERADGGGGVGCQSGLVPLASPPVASASASTGHQACDGRDGQGQERERCLHDDVVGFGEGFELERESTTDDSLLIVACIVQENCRHVAQGERGFCK